MKSPRLLLASRQQQSDISMTVIPTSIEDFLFVYPIFLNNIILNSDKVFDSFFGKVDTGFPIGRTGRDKNLFLIEL